MFCRTPRLRRMSSEVKMMPVRPPTTPKVQRVYLKVVLDEVLFVNLKQKRVKYKNSNKKLKYYGA